MKQYEVIIDKVEWFGGDAGYGQMLERKEMTKSFPSTQAALRFAYGIVNKSDKKARNQYTRRIKYHVDIIAGKDYYGVQIHDGKIRVWTKNEYGSLWGYLLNKDGTINRRGGIQ